MTTEEMAEVQRLLALLVNSYDGYDGAYSALELAVTHLARSHPEPVLEALHWILDD